MTAHQITKYVSPGQQGSPTSRTMVSVDKDGDLWVENLRGECEGWVALTPLQRVGLAADLLRSVQTAVVGESPLD